MSFTDVHYRAQAPIQAPLSEKIICLEWRPCERNTLRGFAKIKVVSWSLIVDGVAIHEKNDRKWAQLPGRPQLDKDGNALKDENGKVKYAKILEIDDKRVSWEFSEAVVQAVGRKMAA
jgi:hypothetical protein